MEEKKPVKSVETSASYIAWSLKELVQEMKQMNASLKELIEANRREF